MTRLQWLGAVLGLLAATATAGPDESCSLSVGWEPYGNYIFVNEDGEVDGVDIELMKIVAKEIGCEVIFKQLPWTRQLLEMEAGRIDVGTSVRKSPDREAYSWFSAPYRENQMALYVRRGETANYVLDTLAAIPETGFRLGIVDGYYYGPRFDELMQKSEFARQIEKTVDYETNIRMLVYSRIDGILAEDVEALIGEAKDLGYYNDLEIYPLAIPGSTFHLMFSKKSVDPAIVEAVNAALGRIQADGRLQRIFAKYLE